MAVAAILINPRLFIIIYRELKNHEESQVGDTHGWALPTSDTNASASEEQGNKNE